MMQKLLDDINTAKQAINQHRRDTVQVWCINGKAVGLAAGNGPAVQEAIRGWLSAHLNRGHRRKKGYSSARRRRWLDWLDRNWW